MNNSTNVQTESTAARLQQQSRNKRLGSADLMQIFEDGKVRGIEIKGQMTEREVPVFGWKETALEIKFFDRKNGQKFSYDNFVDLPSVKALVNKLIDATDDIRENGVNVKSAFNKTGEGDGIRFDIKIGYE